MCIFIIIIFEALNNFPQFLGIFPSKQFPAATVHSGDDVDNHPHSSGGSGAGLCIPLDIIYHLEIAFKS